MRPDDVGLGGFDSHTLPPAGSPRAVLALRAMALAGARVPRSARGGRARVRQKPDTVGFKASSIDTVKDAQTSKRVLKPFALAPITARRAFVYSALIPGMGQAALDRKYTGATFFLIEAMSWALLRRSVDDERIAKAFVGDSVPQSYAIDPNTGLAQRDGRGNPIVATWGQTRYTPDLVRARALHVEDWVAVILFNHLFSGADAYVAANLWDLPQHLGIPRAPLPGGGAAMSSRSPSDSAPLHLLLHEDFVAVEPGEFDPPGRDAEEGRRVHPRAGVREHAAASACSSAGACEWPYT